MSVIYALIPVAIIFVIIAVIVFFWAVKSNQFEDIEREGMRILLDDDEEQVNKKDNNGNHDK
ncbi:cbb3-type cytochrome oxidase assembly protein CcoS [Idiomarina seosinensis]|uniref:Cbb3-type cytochrome oxidase assembly protein CcoS n=1 Tax=Idiomarina seosinensis TaxID=281739 RepID=A0A432ZI69_9GAMM|nr:cbb3-type cytochrome oxidase assembly protein CcoS [Idiomarina seosinensis]RUO77584.1 cbb3-type cytochrome oxidase assembly protein CcoS [Idiomarina seosinensis]